MSIIHEALKKASRDETPGPEVEGTRRTRFSSAAVFPPKVILIKIGILSCLIGTVYLVYVERGVLITLFASKAIPTTFNPEKSAAPVSSAAADRPAVTSEKLPGPKPVPSKDPAVSHEKLGVSYLEKEKLMEAEQEFLLAASSAPESPTIQNNLGLVLKKQGRDGEAESRYRAALQMDAANIQAMNNLGLLYEQQNRLDEAKRLYQKAIAAQPNFPDAHLNYAILLERAGYFEESKRHYRSFLAVATPQQERAVQLVKKHLDRLP